VKLLNWQLARYVRDYPEQYAKYRARLEREQLDRVRRPQPVENPAKKGDLETTRGPHYAQYRIVEDML
jgi:hypothetical protein